MSIVWDGKRMRTLSHTRVGFKTFPAEAVTYCCLNLAMCAENGSHQGLMAGYGLAPSMLKKDIKVWIITANNSLSQQGTGIHPYVPRMSPSV